MESPIQLFGRDNIRDLPWPAEDDAQRGRKYLARLVTEGSISFVDNADVETMAVLLDQCVLPVIVANKTSGNGDICSPSSHYVKYPLAEMPKRKDLVAKIFLRSGVLVAGLFLERTNLDKVVYINNWLWTTNPSARLTSSQLFRLNEFIAERFPDHVIIYRSVNRHTCESFYEALLSSHHKMVVSRTVYLVDGSKIQSSKNENVRRDRNLLKKTGYEVVGPDGFTEEDIHRMTWLYRGLYLKKHPDLNPQYNERFFSLVLHENIFTFKALRKTHRIDAFVSYYVQNGVLIGSLVGYDLDLPQDLGLYRQAFAILMSEAETSNLLLNLSAGAGLFKIFRGATPCIEYDAIYDSHLPLHRRLSWSCIQASGIFQDWRRHGRRALT